MRRLFDILEEIPIPDYLKVQLKNFRILAFQYAQLESIRQGRCVDEKGNPIPWYTYPAIDFLESLDLSEKFVFEYGGGSSTLWWAKRAKGLFTVEHDKNWYRKLKEISSEVRNVEVLLREDEEGYVRCILEKDISFDVIVIDGRWRGKCAKAISEKLNKCSCEGYMIVLDNSDWYPGISRFLREVMGLIQVDFHGFGPINGYTWTTSIFLSRNFNFRFKGKRSPLIGGVNLKRDDDLDEPS